MLALLHIPSAHPADPRGWLPIFTDVQALGLDALPQDCPLFRLSAPHHWVSVTRTFLTTHINTTPISSTQCYLGSQHPPSLLTPPDRWAQRLARQHEPLC